ncbi:hypothetical protein GCM10010156_76880 [Planobispora rosea]|uniref:Uncharacterized protein n=1 Tax=Planobispora rosea TaxID=35762 RepID=A0A8J3WH66_PLARO|nr:hypothetical protein [Planobispora rosea]GGT08510.1 hypothetical protein GCM10010156_76880 [Planobispora rosea]GIH89193.1 hypothetical protein Pro02_76010 [Planobispora rosea]
MTFYELCGAGGLAFIQRTVINDRKNDTTHSDAWSLREARAVWIALLSGMVR